MPLKIHVVEPVRDVMLPRPIHKNFFIVLVVDALLFSAAWYGSHLLRFNFEVAAGTLTALSRTLPLIVLTKLIMFYFFDLYQGMWRYTSLGDLFNIIKAASMSGLLMVALILFTHGFTGFARSVFIIDWILTVAFISGFRISVRLYFWMAAREYPISIAARSYFGLRRGNGGVGKNLLIIGAGDCGEAIYREIRDNARLFYNVVGFVDDDPAKVGMKIHGIPVVGTTGELKLISQKLRADEALIAIPSAAAQQMRAIVSSCESAGISFKTVPGLGELIDGNVTIKSIREVAYRDLLKRETVQLEEERIGGYIEGARILVSGAGGSIGSELCRQICRFRPAALVLYERAESSLHDIELELRGNFAEIEIIPQLADIRDRGQLSRAFGAFQPTVVFHTAAYKHVPMLELHPWKAVKNNIIGTRNMIDICKDNGVKRFVLVSTDKAVRPANVMGASKRVAELLVQGQNGRRFSDKRFMTVRFGNVVGSVGSVIPLFKKQIERGGPVTVTHPEVTRYFMTIPEACQLILQAGAMGNGGETFVLDMGQPIKICDMARDLIRFSGFQPDLDIMIDYIGLRPGEKLHEELITEGEGVDPTSHDKIMVLRGQTCDQVCLNGEVDELARLAQMQDAEGIRLKLKEIVPEYSPAPERAFIESLKPTFSAINE